MAGTTTEQIKERLDIAVYLREFLTLTPAGKNFKANCPFHKEKTPSFMVSPDRQSWHCFGCGIGGDVFSFLMRHENIEFGEALRILAEKAGVELRRVNPAEYKFAGLLHEINSIAKNFYMDQLQKSPIAQKYLAERGLSQETIHAFELGFAPNQPEMLNMHLLKQRYSPDDIIRAGLVIKTERGSTFDRFRGRIMFPIHDHFGKCVGFTGRIMPQFDSGEMGKYVNSPETPVFNKSKLLYGYNITKNAIREAGWVLLVEGQMDLLMTYQAGIKNVTASSGTALTGDHLRTLHRATDRLVIAYDADEAGLEAAERAIDLAEASDFNVKIVRISGYKDPADAAQAGGDVLQKAIDAAVPAPEFYFEKHLPLDSFDRRDRKFLTALRVVLSKLKAMASAVDRDYWFKALAKRTGIEERVLLEEAERVEAKIKSGVKIEETSPATEEAPKVTRWDRLSEKLLAACLAKSEGLEVLGEHVEYLTADYRMIHDMLKSGVRTSADARIDELINLLSLRSEDMDEKAIVDLKQHLHYEYVKARRQELVSRIKKAEREGDEVALTIAFQEFSGLPAV